MALNVPTLLFWNPVQWKEREAERPSFDALRSAGLLLNSPEEASLKAAQVAQDAASWWKRPEVQQGRKGFADRHARAHPRWTRDWAAIIQDQIRLARS
jgi:putative transferase (TIGR04331 family)